jgi:amino acid transporter
MGVHGLACSMARSTNHHLHREEASNAAKAVPLGIISAIGLSWVLGFVILIAIAGVIDPDFSNVLGTAFGQPMAQIYFDALGKQGTLGFMSWVFICQYMMGLSITIAASRQMWAFSRDGALPFSSFFRRVVSHGLIITGVNECLKTSVADAMPRQSVTFGHIPFRTVWGAVGVAAILGLLCLIAPAAAQALFSLAVASNNLAWGVPIFARIVWGESKFAPGPFYTGRFSKPIAWTAIVFLCFGICLSMFPVEGPDPDPSIMNYTVVINAAVWLGATLYYVIDARKWFTGPKQTIEGVEAVMGGMTDEQRAELRAEGFDESQGSSDEPTAGQEALDKKSS